MSVAESAAEAGCVQTCAPLAGRIHCSCHTSSRYRAAAATATVLLLLLAVLPLQAVHPRVLAAQPTAARRRGTALSSVPLTALPKAACASLFLPQRVTLNSCRFPQYGRVATGLTHRLPHRRQDSSREIDGPKPEGPKANCSGDTPPSHTNASRCLHTAKMRRTSRSNNQRRVSQKLAQVRKLTRQVGCRSTARTGVTFAPSQS